MDAVASSSAMIGAERAAAYRLSAELLLYPDDRNRTTIEVWRQALRHAPAAVRSGPETFLAHPRAWDRDEYLSVLELAPPCPLYLGAYLYEEPSTCRGAGTSQRNSYMMELKAAYEHFGLDLGGGELADYLPVMLEFLAITFDAGPADEDGVRARFLDLGVRRALPEMLAALERHESPYATLIQALVAVVDDDLADCAAPTGAGGVPAAGHVPVKLEVPS